MKLENIAKLIRWHKRLEIIRVDMKGSLVCGCYSLHIMNKEQLDRFKNKSYTVNDLLKLINTLGYISTKAADMTGVHHMCNVIKNYLYGMYGVKEFAYWGNSEYTDNTYIANKLNNKYYMDVVIPAIAAGKGLLKTYNQSEKYGVDISFMLNVRIQLEVSQLSNEDLSVLKTFLIDDCFNENLEQYLYPNTYDNTSAFIEECYDVTYGTAWLKHCLKLMNLTSVIDLDELAELQKED